MTTTSSTTLEATVHCAASIARVAQGAYQIQADRWGEVRIQGDRDDMPADLHETLGLTLADTYDDTRRGNTYTIYEGKGRGLYSDVDVRLVVVSRALVPDCESVSA